MAKGDNKGISRIDSGSTHGWFVRGYRNNRTYSKLFSDKKCGGKRKALEMAKGYRDQLGKDLERIPKAPRARRIAIRDSRNKTGVLGVCRISKPSANGEMIDCYTVSWRTAPGVQKSTSFSVKKYGEKKAFKMAVDLRREMMRKYYGKDIFRKINTKRREKGIESEAA